MDHIVSEDCGKTWGTPDTGYLKDGIRNPQTALIDGVYILHGRNAALTGFVLYTSKDAHLWDEGCCIADKKGLCYYSNNIVLNQNGKNRHRDASIMGYYYFANISNLHQIIKLFFKKFRGGGIFLIINHIHTTNN